MSFIYAFLCGKNEETTRQHRQQSCKSVYSSNISQSMSFSSNNSFYDKVVEYQQTHRQQTKRYKKKQQEIHNKRDLEHFVSNVRKSLKMINSKGYIRYICFSFWIKHMGQRVLAIELVERHNSNDWKQLIIKQVQNLQYVFNFLVNSLYSNVKKDQKFHQQLNKLFYEMLDMISSTDRWIELNNRILVFYRLKPCKVENLAILPIEYHKMQDEEFGFQIGLLRKIYIQPHFSRKIQFIKEIKPVIGSYSRQRLMISVLEYCLYKSRLVGFGQMLQLLLKAYPPDQNIIEFIEIMKKASLKLEASYLESNPFNSQYISFDLQNTSSFILAGMDKIISLQNHWTSLISYTHLIPNMAIIIKFKTLNNNFRIGIIGKIDNKKHLRDYSNQKQSVILCTHSSCIISKGQKTKIRKIPPIDQIKINIGQNRLQWSYENQTITAIFQIQRPFCLHISMKKGQFRQLPIRRF